MKLLLVLLCAFLAVSSAAKKSSNVKGNRQPNIILFLVDDMGYGDLQDYGNPTTYTPYIHRMVKNGLMFTNMYSPSPVCCPSRAAILTGRHQIRSGIYPHGVDPSSLGGLPHDEITIAEGLKDVGYTTGMLGKWHLGVGKNGSNLPVHHGFDYYYGIPYTHDACPCSVCFYPDVGCYQNPATPSTCHPAEEFVGCPIIENKSILQQPVDLLTLNYHMTNAGTNFIRRSAASGQPFFLYFAFHHTHWPQFAGKMFRNSSIAGPFGDTLREIDWSVGQVFEALYETGTYGNTFVLFTADNGPDLEQQEYGGSAGPFRCGKVSTWEGGFRVPAIAWYPGKIATGRTTKLAAGYDILPTFFNLAGATIPSDRKMDGFDLAPILYNKQDTERTIIPYFPENADPSIGPYALRWKHYKAHFYTKGGNAPPTHYDVLCRNTTELTAHDPPLLFNLWTDPGERDPLTENDSMYYYLLEKMDELRTDFMNDMEWHTSFEEDGEDDSVQPCAKPGCSPWPYCCTIDLLNNPEEHSSNRL
ncbi:PREDICTED: arylsulfatase A-like [Amphimedon queenslandica]|uniref:Sulfatase N-terminal domain-containing protein n=1 Tax=Amphimedon queenslandica TaxID=400682 RepID=A0A1X7UNZ5_AMPQE|nr:PREDICTED: arylsulfatase A-like [Amphimedon queenslandica]|eukprot:XP_003387234.3 PREDICTED: arylsulfatase A-like [Amphimedon queenslandica]